MLLKDKNLFLQTCFGLPHALPKIEKQGGPIFTFFALTPTIGLTLLDLLGRLQHI